MVQDPHALLMATDSVGHEFGLPGLCLRWLRFRLGDEACRVELSEGSFTHLAVEPAVSWGIICSPHDLV